MRTYKVRIWRLTTTPAGNPRVRWVTDGKEHSEAFPNVPLAESFRSELISAQRRGEAFDIRTGLPVSETRKVKAEVPWLQHAMEYAEMKWPESAPNSRRNRADALATVTPALLRKTAGAPRRQDASGEVTRVLAWAKKASVTVTELAEDGDLVRSALRAISQRQNGNPAAATT